jgi:hypothetical protein
MRRGWYLPFSIISQAAGRASSIWPASAVGSDESSRWCNMFSSIIALIVLLNGRLLGS